MLIFLLTVTAASKYAGKCIYDFLTLKYINSYNN